MECPTCSQQCNPKEHPSICEQLYNAHMATFNEEHITLPYHQLQRPYLPVAGPPGKCDYVGVLTTQGKDRVKTRPALLVAHARVVAAEHDKYRGPLLALMADNEGGYIGEGHQNPPLNDLQDVTRRWDIASSWEKEVEEEDRISIEGEVNSKGWYIPYVNLMYFDGEYLTGMMWHEDECRFYDVDGSPSTGEEILKKDELVVVGFRVVTQGPFPVRSGYEIVWCRRCDKENKTNIVNTLQQYRFGRLLKHVQTNEKHCITEE